VYLYDEQLHGRISYPKFQTADGSYVSLRDGIWDPATGYDRERLTVINLPVLKSHHATYGATRRDELVAGVDPVAIDIWAVTNILVPAFLDNGYAPPWPHPEATPDDPASDFRVYLDRSMSELLAAGYDVTNDLASIDVVTVDVSLAVFADGFDSGDTAAWSAVVP
jgi:hypothetical protein